MFHHLAGLAEARRIPVQMHTGATAGNATVLENTNPALLTNVFYRYPAGEVRSPAHRLSLSAGNGRARETVPQRVRGFHLGAHPFARGQPADARRVPGKRPGQQDPGIRRRLPLPRTHLRPRQNRAAHRGARCSRARWRRDSSTRSRRSKPAACCCGRTRWICSEPGAYTRDMTTLLDVLAAAPGGRTALVLPETGARVTYDALRERVRAMAAGLRRGGNRRGDAGGHRAPERARRHRRLSGRVAGRHGRAAQPRLQIRGVPLLPGGHRTRACSSRRPDGADEARRAAADRGIPVVTPDLAAAGPMPEPAPDDVALVLHTSGSTGRPKRVPLRHRNLALSDAQHRRYLPARAGRRFAVPDAALPRARPDGLHHGHAAHRRRRGGARALQSRWPSGGWCASTPSRGTRRCRRSTSSSWRGAATAGRRRRCASCARAAHRSRRT